MFYKNPLNILAECAANDLASDTMGALNEAATVKRYESYETIKGDVRYPAEIVPVHKIGNEYYTEMQFLAPYIKNNGIRHVAEALSDVARANGLPDKAVGLLVESDLHINNLILEAKSKGKNAKDAELKKISKGEDVVDAVKKKGFKVAKKKPSDQDKEKAEELKGKKAKDEGCKKEGCDGENCGKEECGTKECGDNCKK